MGLGSESLTDRNLLVYLWKDIDEQRKCVQNPERGLASHVAGAVSLLQATYQDVEQEWSELGCDGERTCGYEEKRRNSVEGGRNRSTRIKGCYCLSKHINGLRYWQRFFYQGDAARIYVNIKCGAACCGQCCLVWGSARLGLRHKTHRTELSGQLTWPCLRRLCDTVHVMTRR